MARVVGLTLFAMVFAPLYANPQVAHSSVKKISAQKTSAQRVSTKTTHAAARTLSVARVSNRASLHVPVSYRSSHAASAHAARGRFAQATRVIHTPPAPSYQLHPDTDRYVEIQKTLADRGYFKGDPNGLWADDSVDAMRRFQADQKIDNDGKIDALSLISLGLGPKHDGSTAATTHVTPVAATADTSSSSLLQPQSSTAAPGTGVQPH